MRSRPVLGRSTVATRQLASRARRRVRSAPRAADMRADRSVVDAFLTAAREGNFEALLAVLDPQVVMRGDEAAVRLGGPRQLSGSAAVAKFFQGRAQAARFILADGAPAILVAPGGRMLLAMRVTIRGRQDRGHRGHRRARAPDELRLLIAGVRKSSPGRHRR